MSPIPSPSRGLTPEHDHPSLRQRALSVEERRSRWALRAAQWRACELATEIFGTVLDTQMTGIRTGGSLRGLLRLVVPFHDLDTHREAEARFLACAAKDPILTRVPLLYVVGP